MSADWAALTGARLAYTTTRDELHWLNRFFGDDLVTAETRRGHAGRAGGLWLAIAGRVPTPIGWPARRPGFSSYVLRQPDLTVIVLSNVQDAPVEKLGGRAGRPGAALGRRRLRRPAQGRQDTRQRRPSLSRFCIGTRC